MEQIKTNSLSDNKTYMMAESSNIQSKAMNIKQSQYNKKEFLRVSIPIQEIDVNNDKYYSIVANGKLEVVDIGLKLIISKSFKPIFGVNNGDIEQIQDAIAAQVEGGLILWGGENILSNLINRVSQEWQLDKIPVTNDLICDGQLFWGDLSTLRQYKNSKSMLVKIEPASYDQNILNKNTPLNELRFKALGFYIVEFEKTDPVKTEVGNVPFFINIDLNNMILKIEENNIDLRKEFINLFYLDESYRKERLKNKNKVMPALKTVIRPN